MTTPREWILSRFRTASARKKGGITTRAVYGGQHSFALADLDAELAKMRAEGVLGFSQELWFLRGGGADNRTPPRSQTERPRRSTGGPSTREPV